jgi:hypothetical protein
MFAFLQKLLRNYSSESATLGSFRSLPTQWQLVASFSRLKKINYLPLNFSLKLVLKER